MSNDQVSPNDPLGFVRNMWGNMGFSLPGMVAPTFDTDELEKRIQDLKAVEGWLRMNLSMLQMTIQGLEMQTTTIAAVKAMGNMAANAAQQVAQDARDSQAASARAEAAKVAAAEPEPAPAATGDKAAEALSQAAMWPWNLMQQMQEHLQEQAAAAKAAQPPKPAAKKPATKAAAGTAAKRPARKA